MITSTLESLINAIDNQEPDEAANLAAAILVAYADEEEYAKVDIDSIIRGFLLNNENLHKSLGKIISLAAVHVDFSTFSCKYGGLIKEYCQTPALCFLFPQLIVRFVPDHCSPQDIVQSTLFPYMVMHLACDNSVSNTEMEAALHKLIQTDREVAFLIDKTLATLSSPKSNSSVYARIITLRVGLAIHSESTTLLKLHCDSIFSSQSDVLLLANILEVAANFVQSISRLNCLTESGFLQNVIDIFYLEDSLRDIAIELFIKCVVKDPEFIEYIKGLFESDPPLVTPSSHPAVLQLEMLMFKLSDQTEIANNIRRVAMNEVGVLQLNAFYAMELLIADDLHEDKQKLFFLRVFPDIFDFIAQQLPLKGDILTRLAMYSLFKAALKKDWLAQNSYNSQKFISFILDRSSDSSISGLQEKYNIAKRLMELSSTPSDLKLKLSGYIAEGVRGRNVPIPSVASRIDQ